MKNIRKIFLVGVLFFATIVGFYLGGKTKNDVGAATIPEGYARDESPDVVSISDLNLGGLTNQSSIGNRREDTTATFNKTNTNGSLILKFKYKVEDTTAVSENALYIYMEVSNPLWNDKDGNALLLRGDGIFYTRYNGSYSYKQLSALTEGMHDVEIGRIALLKDNQQVGDINNVDACYDYFVYVMVDGVELHNSITPYNNENIGNKILFHYGKKNYKNIAYDANYGNTLTYEKPQVVSISDIYNGQKELKSSGDNYQYSLTNAPANKSAIFVSNIDYCANDYTTMCMYGVSNDNNWNKAGSFEIHQTYCIIGLTDADGVGTGSKELKYYFNPEDTSENTTLVGTKCTLEWGKLAVLENGVFNGKYHVYVKINGITLFSIDQALCNEVAAGGLIRIGGKDFKMQDAYTYEEPKVISVENLAKNKVPVGLTFNPTNAGGETLTFNNTYHKENYSISLKFKYTPNDDKENQFHLNKVDIWGAEGSIILNRNNKEGFVGINGWKGFNYDMTPGTTYDIEYTRKAVLYDGAFAGKYLISLSINGTVVKEGIGTLADADAQTNQLFISVGNGTSLIADANPTTFETADEISVKDLKVGGTLVGNEYILTDSPKFTYDATAAHKSVVVKFDYVTTNPANMGCQFIFANGWYSTINGNQHGGTIWFNGNNVFMYVDGGDAYSVTNPINAAGTYSVEIGKLYATSGTNAGKYYLYAKVNGEFVIGNYVEDPLPDYAGIFLTANNGDKIVNNINNETTYETPDVLSIGDLKDVSNNEPIGYTINLNSAGGQAYAYNATAEHKSVVLKFKYNASGLDDKTTCDFDFKISFANTMANKGFLWLRTDNFITIDDTGNYYFNPSIIKADGSYNLEAGKLYITSGDNAGKYYIYVKNGAELVFESVISDMPESSYLHISGNNGDSIQDINYVPTVYEQADEISVSDLLFGGQPVGTSVTLDAHKTFSYVAAAEHKSVVFKFKYQISDPTTMNFQIHFNSGWIPDAQGGVIWFQNQGNMFIRKDTVDGKTDYASTTGPLTEAKEYNVEVGKLYIVSGAPGTEGKYYLYVKVDGELILSYIQPTMPEVAGIFSTEKNGSKLLDVNYVPTEYEAADVISVGDLTANGNGINGKIFLDNSKLYGYNATAEHKSVVYKFVYQATMSVSTGDTYPQIHFNNVWTNNGYVWVRPDSIFIGVNGGYEYKSSPIGQAGLYDVEVGKLYITKGENQGKYYVYAKVNGQLIVDYVFDTLNEVNNLYITGGNSDYMYDLDYLSVELDSSLYLYKWDLLKSGLEFTATIDKPLYDYQNVTAVGFVLTEVGNPSSQVIVPGKLVVSGNTYVVKAALAGMNDANIIKNYEAKLYYVIGENTMYTDTIVDSLYDELQDMSGLTETQVTALNAIKAKVLNVVVDEDTMNATGASKTGDENQIVLTGANESYASFILNGEILLAGQMIKIGYTKYVVGLSSNAITLTKQAKEMVYGGSEHFVELNSGHDPEMTAANLSPMTTELGLNTVRLDIYFDNILSVNEGNVLTVNNGNVAKVQAVIDELKTNGGVTDFLAVLWVAQPIGFVIPDNGPWYSRTCPDPVDHPELYLKWLQLNGEAAKMTAKLFPDIHNFETWNEAEMNGGVTCPFCKYDGTDYSTAEKAKILTDLMYYYNKGIKEVNPKNILTTPSLCCSQKVSGPFAVTSPNFLKALYTAIKDTTPVPGFETADTNPNNYFQVINIHPYIGYGTTKDNWTSFVGQFHTIALNNGDAGTEIWITEFGFAQNRETNAQTLLLNILGQAQNIDYLTRFYFYKVHDYANTQGVLDDDKWGLYNYDGTIKAIGTAVKNLINPDEE